MHPKYSPTGHMISLATGGCGTGNIPGIIAGVMVASVLLALLSLTAGISIGVVLGRKVQRRKVEIPQGQGAPQERIGSTNVTEEDGTKNYTYYNVGDDTSIDGRVVLYQGLDVGTLDYVGEYTKLRGGTYQELDLKGREEEHHYQTTHREEGTWKK